MEQCQPSPWTEPRGEGYHVGEDGAEFLDTKVFGHRPCRNIRCYGFKLFYDHARFDQYSATAWDYILSHHEIKIIHLIRRNLLHALISREIALRTQQWHRLIEDANPLPPPLPPFALDPEMCRRYFEQIVTWRTWADEAFAKHPVLTVQYETELCTHFEATASRVFEFLGSMQWYSRPGMVKQQAIPASQQLSNFEQLREFFHGGPYAEFFDNDVLLAAT
jgi:LPS sulfotransferase NodH